MMYEIFSKAFSSDLLEISRHEKKAPSSQNWQLVELISQHGGKSFNNGLYRVLPSDDLSRWCLILENAFPQFTGKITPFSVDWLGRVFALDATRVVDGQPAVAMFEPGTAEVLEVPCNLENFHESELIEYREAALAESFYEQWRASGGAVPSLGQCIGYKKPLFLGGADTVSNLTVWDLDVYWEILTQLISRVKGLPAGSAIENITIS